MLIKVDAVPDPAIVVAAVARPADPPVPTE